MLYIHFSPTRNREQFSFSSAFSPLFFFLFFFSFWPCRDSSFFFGMNGYILRAGQTCIHFSPSAFAFFRISLSLSLSTSKPQPVISLAIRYEITDINQMTRHQRPDQRRFSRIITGIRPPRRRRASTSRSKGACTFSGLPGAARCSSSKAFLMKGRRLAHARRPHRRDFRLYIFSLTLKQHHFLIPSHKTLPNFFS